jgi:DnaK suppressor protein
MPIEQQQIDFLGKRIDQQYSELLQEVREDLAQNGGSEYVELLGGTGAESKEEAVRDLLWGLNSTLFGRHIREIRDIERARMRISEGDYGVCSDCGDEIAFERLSAHPLADRCLYCQSEHEHKHKHGKAHEIAIYV